MTAQQNQTIQANITLITSTMAHQFTGDVVGFTEQNISGEYQVIDVSRRGVYHIFCNDRGFDLFLDEQEFDIVSSGKNFKAGKNHL
jgi:hypothetical protein